MTDDPLVRARKRAELAVQGMGEGPLKIAAFQTILAKLLAEATPAEEAQHTPAKAPVGALKQPGTLTGRILAMRSEGFFKTQRSLGEVRDGLALRGWHHALTSLSGAMQAMVQRRELRRERVSTGKRKTWKYANR